MVEPENIVGVGNNINVGPDGMNVVEAEEVRVPRATNVLGQKSKILKCYSMLSPEMQTQISSTIIKHASARHKKI